MISLLEQTVYIVKTPNGWLGSKFDNVLKEAADAIDVPVMMRKMPGNNHILTLYFYRRSEARAAFGALIKNGQINSGTSCDILVSTVQYREV